MPFSGRLLVSVNGQTIDEQTLRYASMVARLNSCHRVGQPYPQTIAIPAEGLVPATSQPYGAGNDDPEIRFVCLLPTQPNAARSTSASRSALRAQIRTHFQNWWNDIAVTCDLVKGHALHRLATVAADFDSDLLLVCDASLPRRKLARLATEVPCAVWIVPPDWAPVLRRVLVPIDFSVHSARCLRTAIDLMRPFPQAKCLALHAYQHESRLVDEALDRQRRQELIKQFESFMAGIDTRGIVVEPVFCEAHRIDGEISRMALRHSVDLIVMASRGRTRAARWLIGSRTENMIAQSGASMLVLKSSSRPVGFWSALRERLRQRDRLQFS